MSRSFFLLPLRSTLRLAMLVIGLGAAMSLAAADGVVFDPAQQIATPGGPILAGSGTIATDLEHNAEMYFSFRLPCDEAGRVRMASEHLVFYAPFLREGKTSLAERPFLKQLSDQHRLGSFTVTINHQGPAGTRYAYADTGWHERVWDLRDALAEKFGFAARHPLVVMGESLGANMVYELMRVYPEEVEAGVLIGCTLWGENPVRSQIPRFVGYTMGDDSIAEALEHAQAWQESAVPYSMVVGLPDPERRGGGTYHHTPHQDLLLAASDFAALQAGMDLPQVEEPLPVETMLASVEVVGGQRYAHLYPDEQADLFGAHHDVSVPASLRRVFWDIGLRRAAERSRSGVISARPVLEDPESAHVMLVHQLGEIDVDLRRDTLGDLAAYGMRVDGAWLEPGHRAKGLPHADAGLVVAEDWEWAASQAEAMAADSIWLAVRSADPVPEGLLEDGWQVLWLQAHARQPAPGAGRLLPSDAASEIERLQKAHEKRVQARDGLAALRVELGVAGDSASATQPNDRDRKRLARAEKQLERTLDRGLRHVERVAREAYRSSEDPDGPVLIIPWRQVDHQWRAVLATFALGVQQRMAGTEPENVFILPVPEVWLADWPADR